MSWCSSTAPAYAAFAWMAMVAAMYEPLRLSLSHSIKMNIGGVGGVGGLANMLGADDPRCVPGSTRNTTLGDGFCYESGNPFTPFSWIMLVLWVGPLLIAALFAAGRTFPDRRQVSGAVSSVEQESLLSFLATVWVGLNLMWFLIPLSVFWFGLTKGDVVGSVAALRICAVAIAASHPLSWNLMVASIPSSGVTTKLLDCDRETMFGCHRFVSYFTVFWGVLHGIGELLYFAMTESPRTGHRLIIDKLLLRDNGEDWIYLLGFFALLLLVAQGLVGYCRNFIRKSRWHFRKIHRNLAFALLFLAAAHWIPFYLFLMPAIAIHGVGLACLSLEKGQEGDDSKSLTVIPSHLARHHVGQLLVLALLTCFGTTYGVWWMREAYMISDRANLSIPFLFPVLATGSSLLTSAMISRIYMLILPDQEDDDIQLETMLNDSSPLVDGATTSSSVDI